MNGRRKCKSGEHVAGDTYNWQHSFEVERSVTEDFEVKTQEVECQGHKA